MDLSLIVNSLASASIVASLLIITIFIIKQVFKKMISAKWHYIIWFVLLFRLAVPYMVHSPINLSDFFTDKVSASADQGLKEKTTKDTLNSGAANNSNPKIQTTASNTDNSKLKAHQTEKKPFSPLNSIRKFFNAMKGIKIDPGLLIIIWLLGMAVLSAYYFLFNIFFWVKVKNGTVFTDHSIIKLLEECKEKLGVRTNISIIQTCGVHIPAIFGVTRPWLLLPEKVLKNLEPESLRYVILHELAHLKRKDIIVNWIALILQIVHWFNPIVWIAFYRMRIDRELACDEAVLMHLDSGEGKKYGHTILDMVEIISGRLSFAGTAGILESKSQIKDRISMISNFRVKPKFPVFTVVIAILLSCSIFVNANELSDKGSADSKAQDKKDIVALNTQQSQVSKIEETKSSTPGAAESDLVGSNLKMLIDEAGNVLQTAPLNAQNSVTEDNEAVPIKTNTTKTADEKRSSTANLPVANATKKQNSDTLDEVPFDESNFPVSTSAKAPETKLSELLPSGIASSGTIERVNGSIVRVNAYKDDVVITKVSPDKDLKAGVETVLTVEIEYNLTSENMGVLMVCANEGIFEGESPESCDQISTWDISKGRGRYKFHITVVPKHWENGFPFYITAYLQTIDRTSIFRSKNYFLGIKGYAQNQQDITKLRVEKGVTIEKLPDGSFNISLDKSEMPSKLAKMENISQVNYDFANDLDVNLNSWVSYQQQHNLISWTYDQNPMRFKDNNGNYMVLLFFDKDMNFLGYYAYQKK